MTSYSNGKILVSAKFVVGLGLIAVWYMRKDRYRKGYDKGFEAGRKSVTDKVFKEDHEDAFVMDTDEGSFKVSEIKKKERKPLIEVNDTNEKSKSPYTSYRSYYKTKETSDTNEE